MPGQGRLSGGAPCFGQSGPGEGSEALWPVCRVGLRRPSGCRWDAHNGVCPGPLGTIDRVSEAKDRTAQAGEEAQIKDWKKIKVYLDSLPVSEGAAAIREVGST